MFGNQFFGPQFFGAQMFGPPPVVVVPPTQPQRQSPPVDTGQYVLLNDPRRRKREIAIQLIISGALDD